jgi:hypothetical protein
MKSTGNLGAAGKLVESLQGSKKISENIPSLKYGREMEGKAKEVFWKYFKTNHREAIIRECGLFIHEEKQYLGASPDSLVECACCGKGVVEIKCPSSIIDKVPTADNLSYLVLHNGKTVLKQNHAYYAQVQGQMAITHRSLCYFFVYSPVGQHLETITLNDTYWHKLQANLSWFHDNYLQNES